MRNKIALTAFVLAMLACSVVVNPTPQPIAPAPITVVAPTALPAPTATPAPSPTVIPTPNQPFFTVEVSSGANCRLGPSIDYPRLTGITKYQTVPIIGVVPPYLERWWFVNVKGVSCWVKDSLGTTTGNTGFLPTVYAPPVPPAPKTVKVGFQNSTGGPICRIVADNGYNFTPFTWKKGQFKDGQEKTLVLPVGYYDEIQVFNCKDKPKLVAEVENVWINYKHDYFELLP